MSIERSTDTPPAHFSATAAAALIGIAALLAIAVVIHKKAPDTAAGLTWALAALLPVSGLVFLYQGVAERYDYMASAGLVFAAVSLHRHLRARPLKIALSAVLAIWTLCGAARLYARLGDWSSEETLYQTSLEATPKSWILLLNLGNAYLQRGDLPKAQQTYVQTLQTNPNAIKAMVNLGAALEMEGNLPAAEQEFRRALGIDSNRADIYSNLATVVYTEGRVHEAAALFRKAIQLDPRDATSYFNLGLLYAHSGLPDIAAQLYEQALQINPDYTDAQRALASLRKK
jgi:tetratricopeptide (TPR) repeat protein